MTKKSFERPFGVNPPIQVIVLYMRQQLQLGVALPHQSNTFPTGNTEKEVRNETKAEIAKKKSVWFQKVHMSVWKSTNDMNSRTHAWTMQQLFGQREKGTETV